MPKTKIEKLKEQSLASKRREEQRKNPKTLKFKKEINDFLKDKEPVIEYAIKRDLAVMTNMPFYKDRPEKIKIDLSPAEILKKYMKIFIKHEDKEFIIKLIKALNKNQNQIIRKVAPKIGVKSEIWEHVVPAKFIVDELIKMVMIEDTSDLDQLLKVYQAAGQRGITKEQDKLLNEYRSSMPDGWDWKGKNVDPLARHTLVGIYHEE